MDPLFQQLMQRQLAQGQPPEPTPSVPPNPSAKVPQRVQRFNNTQALQDAYRNGWQPNPMLLRASQT